MDRAFKKNFLKGSAAASIGQVASMVFHFFSITMLARTMQIKEFGFYSLILAIVYLFNTVGSFGLEVTLVKFITADDADDRQFTLFPILLLKLIVTSFICMIFFTFSNFILPLFDVNLQEFSLYITFLIFLGSFRDVFYNLLQGLNLFKKYAFVQTISAAVRAGLIVVFIFSSILTLDKLIAIEIFTTSLSVIVLLALIPFKGLLKFSKDFFIYKRIIKFALPVYFNNLFSIIHGKSNLFLIGIYLTPASVAYYDVASKIPEALSKLFNSYIMVYFPNSAKLLARGDKDSAINLMNTSVSILSILLGFMAFLSFGFGKDLAILLFSEKYQGISLAFALLIFNFQIRSSATIMGYSILSAGYPEIPMKVNIITSIISLGGTMLFLPTVGYIGAVYSLLLMNITSLFLYQHYLKKLEFNLDLKKLLQPLFILVIFGGIFFFLPGSNSFIILKIAIILVYISLNWFLVEEVKTLLKNFKKIIPIFK